MFMGRYDHTIDAKGRTIIPAKFRDDLGETFVITRGLDGCLLLYPSKEWDVFVAKLQALPSNMKTRNLQRNLMSKALEVTLDKQGRILIPALLRGLAGLEKDLAFVGIMNHIEIWDKKRLDEQEEAEDEEVFAKSLEELEISL